MFDASLQGKLKCSDKALPISVADMLGDLLISSETILKDLVLVTALNSEGSIFLVSFTNP